MIAEPEDREALRDLLGLLGKGDLNGCLLGGGTNIIFGEEGFNGVVLRLGERYKFVRRKGEDVLHVGAATALSVLLDKTVSWGLSGLEFCLGIPGTVGGAVAGNAGTDGLGIHDRILRLYGMTRDGKDIALEPGEYTFGYRHVSWPMLVSPGASSDFHLSLDSEMIITSIDIRLSSTEPERQKELLEKYRRIRSRQPATRGTSGSIFKNPPGKYAGRLIDEAGLKGKTIGGACVSPLHGNWIVNKGNATAGDVLNLISEIQKTVLEKFGILLEPEVRIVRGH